MHTSAHVYLSACMNVLSTHVKGSTVLDCFRLWLLPAAMVIRRNSHLGEDKGLEIRAESGNNNHQKKNCGQKSVCIFHYRYRRKKEERIKPGFIHSRIHI